MTIEIEHRPEGTKGGFYVERDGEIIAEMTYSKAGEEKIIIDHTWVDDSLRGQGVAGRLVERGVEFARAESLKVIPLCSYTKARIEKHEELQDVLDPGFKF